VDEREERSPQQIEQMRQRAGRFGARGKMSEEEMRYVSTPAPFGEYTVFMSANGQTVERRVSILTDE
jgi:hypothetical protein